jgi:hypothetical protein
MDAFLESIQQSAVARFVGESGSLLGYPTILFLHTLGLGTVAGLNVGLDLRLLGFGSRISLAPLERMFPLMWIGFVLSAVSGVALLISDPVTRLHQVIFYVKLGFVALAVVNMQMIRNRIFRSDAVISDAVPPDGKRLAIVSLILWLAATTAGRLIAYI